MSNVSLWISYLKIKFQASYLCRYVEVNMNSAAMVWPLFNSLQAFWPGLQVKQSLAIYDSNLALLSDCCIKFFFTVLMLFLRFWLEILTLLCGLMQPFSVSGRNMDLHLKGLIWPHSMFRYLCSGSFSRGIYMGEVSSDKTNKTSLSTCCVIMPFWHLSLHIQAWSKELSFAPRVDREHILALQSYQGSQVMLLNCQCNICDCKLFGWLFSLNAINEQIFWKKFNAKTYLMFA